MENVYLVKYKFKNSNDEASSAGHFCVGINKKEAEEKFNAYLANHIASILDVEIKAIDLIGSSESPFNIEKRAIYFNW